MIVSGLFFLMKINLLQINTCNLFFFFLRHFWNFIPFFFKCFDFLLIKNFLLHIRISSCDGGILWRLFNNTESQHILLFYSWLLFLWFSFSWDWIIFFKVYGIMLCFGSRCMETVESQPGPLIDYLRKGLSQPQEHRWRQFTCVTRRGGARLPPLLDPI